MLSFPSPYRIIVVVAVAFPFLHGGGVVSGAWFDALKEHRAMAILNKLTVDELKPIEVDSEFEAPSSFVELFEQCAALHMFIDIIKALNTACSVPTTNQVEGATVDVTNVVHTHYEAYKAAVAKHDFMQPVPETFAEEFVDLQLRMLGSIAFTEKKVSNETHNYMTASDRKKLVHMSKVIREWANTLRGVKVGSWEETPAKAYAMDARKNSLEKLKELKVHPLTIK